MNVLQFICSTGFYGAERWVVALANHLDRAEVNCHILSSSEDPEADIEVLAQFPGASTQIHRVEMQGRFDLGAVNRIAELIRRNSIDIIHTHGYKSDLIGLLAARKTGIRTVSTPHGFGEKHGMKMRLYFALGGLGLRYFDVVSPLSRKLVEQVRGMGVHRTRIEYIANGVDISDVDKECRGSRQTRDVSSLTFGYVGRLVRGKRLQDTLAVFDKIWQQHPQARLMLVGEGDDREQLEVQAAALACADNIEFLGFRSDRLQLMRQIDVFMMTSESEGIPRVVMEALAMRIPVVAYRIPGVEELVIHGKTGLLAELGDTAGLLDGCLRLAAEPELAVEFGEAGRRHIEAGFSAEKMALQYTGLYRRLMQADGA